MEIKSNNIVIFNSQHPIEITLDNGNKIQLFEEASGILQIRNITGDNYKDKDQLGLMIESIAYGIVNIIPEG